MSGRSWRIGPLVAVALLGGCGGGIQGVWDASGEVEEGRFFAFALDTRDSATPVADLGFAGGDRVRVAVCGLVEKDGHVEFKMDPDARAQTCEAMKSPYRFIGDFGRDVMTGRVLDWTGREVGRFRAYRGR